MTFFVPRSVVIVHKLQLEKELSENADIALCRRLKQVIVK